MHMNCKKYRAALVGLIVAAFVLGVCFYISHMRENEVPTDGMLVDNCEEIGEDGELWA